jgi:hypothetical protein
VAPVNISSTPAKASTLSIALLLSFSLLLTCLLLAGCSSRQTGPAFVQNTEGKISTGAVNSVAFTSPNTAGNLIVAFVLWDNTGDVSLSDSMGNTYVSAVGPTRWQNDQWRVQTFYASDIKNGDNIVTATFSSNVNAFGIVYVHEYSGIDRLNPVDAVSSRSGTGSAVSSGPVATTNPTDLLFGGIGSTGSVTASGQSYSVRSKVFGNMTADTVVTTTGSYEVSANQNGDAWTAHFIAFRADHSDSAASTPIPTAAHRITAPLRASATNPNYFVDSVGKAVALTGSHTWNNVQDWGANGSIQNLDFNSYVSMLTRHNQNFTLLWRTELPHFCNLPTGAVTDYDVAEHPWLRTGPGVASDGKPKFDLNRFDQSYFDRLRERVVQLQEAGIYAGVYFFSGEWVGSFRCAGGNDGYPFSGANNINDVDDGGGSGSVTMTAPNAITDFQDAYVRKTIDTLNDLPNVLWIVSEESPSGVGWWNGHLIDVARTYEATKPLQHPIGYGAMSGGNDDDAVLYNSNADWVSPETRISPTSSCGTGSPVCKVNINDSDHSYFGMWKDSAQSNRNYFWENFARGNSVAFMDPYTVYYPSGNRNLCVSPVNGICSDVDNRWDNVRATMGYIRSYADRMNLIAMSPQNSLSSTGFALANPAPQGSELLVYNPSGGGFTVDLSYTTRTITVEWFNPATGVVIEGGTVPGGSASQTFNPPFPGDAVLYLADHGGRG